MPEQHVLEIDQIARLCGPYPQEAYHFVADGLSYTMEHVHANVDLMHSDDRHVSGGQLCLGLRDYAIERYGCLARVVLSTWNIHRTEDFGRIVFAMIEHKRLSKNADDSIEDFRNVFEFDEGFSRDALLQHVGRG